MSRLEIRYKVSIRTILMKTLEPDDFVEDEFPDKLNKLANNFDSEAEKLDADLDNAECISDKDQEKTDSESEIQYTDNPSYHTGVASVTPSTRSSRLAKQLKFVRSIFLYVRCCTSPF